MSNELTAPSRLAEIAIGDAAAFGIWASFDTSTPEGKRLAYNCSVSHDFEAASVLNETIEVEHAVIFPAQKVDADTGELNTWLATVLITPDGGKIQAGSKGIIRSLARLESLFGKMPWVPAVKLKIVQQPMSGGKRYYTLELV